MDDLIPSAIVGILAGFAIYFFIPKEYSAFKASSSGSHSAAKHHAQHQIAHDVHTVEKSIAERTKTKSDVPPVKNMLQSKGFTDKNSGRFVVQIHHTKPHFDDGINRGIYQSVHKPGTMDIPLSA
jgi:hypothetical protein